MFPTQADSRRILWQRKFSFSYTVHLHRSTTRFSGKATLSWLTADNLGNFYLAMSQSALQLSVETVFFINRRVYGHQKCAAMDIWLDHLLPLSHTLVLNKNCTWSQKLRAERIYYWSSKYQFLDLALLPRHRKLSSTVYTSIFSYVDIYCIPAQATCTWHKL